MVPLPDQIVPPVVVLLKLVVQLPAFDQVAAPALQTVDPPDAVTYLHCARLLPEVSHVQDATPDHAVHVLPESPEVLFWRYIVELCRLLVLDCKLLVLDCKLLVLDCKLLVCFWSCTVRIRFWLVLWLVWDWLC